MENVSNCQLLLNVEVKKIQGTIALNIPPHPSGKYKIIKLLLFFFFFNHFLIIEQDHFIKAVKV